MRDLKPNHDLLDLLLFQSSIFWPHILKYINAPATSFCFCDQSIDVIFRIEIICLLSEFPLQGKHRLLLLLAFDLVEFPEQKNHTLAELLQFMFLHLAMSDTDQPRHGFLVQWWRPLVDDSLQGVWVSDGRDGEGWRRDLLGNNAGKSRELVGLGSNGWVQDCLFLDAVHRGGRQDVLSLVDSAATCWPQF